MFLAEEWPDRLTDFLLTMDIDFVDRKSVNGLLPTFCCTNQGVNVNQMSSIYQSSDNQLTGI
jgi:hypothetical protein